MQHEDNYILKLLYSLADKQPYRIGPTHVIPEAKFNLSYPNPVDQKFVPFTIPQIKR